MAKNKEKLGKGLRALISNIDKPAVEGEEKVETVKELSKTIAEIDIQQVEANPFQPRKEFKADELQELSDSIKVHGLIQPITVRSIGGGKFQIISGERRWRASKKAGLKSIPAYIRVTDDQGLLEMAIVENIQRSDLNAMEVAVSFQRLIDECDLSHEEMAGRVNKNRSTITNYLRLLRLPPRVQKALKQEVISMGHAKSLIGVEPIESQLELFQMVIDGSLSVRATEDLVAKFKRGIPTSSSARTTKAEDPEIKKIRNRLMDYLGAPVMIKRNSKGKGNIQIHFNNDKELNEILDILDE